MLDHDLNVQNLFRPYILYDLYANAAMPQQEVGSENRNRIAVYFGQTCLKHVSKMLKVSRLGRVLLADPKRFRSTDQTLKEREAGRPRAGCTTGCTSLFRNTITVQVSGEPGSRQRGYLPYLCACGIRKHLTRVRRRASATQVRPI
jgi:hypothetical protein